MLINHFYSTSIFIQMSYNNKSEDYTMNIVFMGTPDFAIPILEMLHQTYGVCLVVTQPDKAVGRKKY